jgi:hypothetical protein
MIKQLKVVHFILQDQKALLLQNLDAVFNIKSAMFFIKGIAR